MGILEAIYTLTCARTLCSRITPRAINFLSRSVRENLGRIEDLEPLTYKTPTGHTRHGSTSHDAREERKLTMGEVALSL